MNLPSTHKNTRTPSWWASMKGEAMGYDVSIPEMIPVEGINYCPSENATNRDEKLTIIRMKEALKKVMENKEYQRLNDGLKLLPRFSILVEKEATRGFKTYLTILAHKRRTLLTRLRFSNHTLGIQMGRQTIPKVDPQGWRICRLCPQLVVEDPIHMLGGCLGKNQTSPN